MEKEYLDEFWDETEKRIANKKNLFIIVEGKERDGMSCIIQNLGHYYNV